MWLTVYSLTVKLYNYPHLLVHEHTALHIALRYFTEHTNIHARDETSLKHNSLATSEAFQHADDSKQ